MAASDPTPYVATPTGTLQGVAAFSWDGSAWQPSGRAGPDVATPTGVLQGVAAFSWSGSAWTPTGQSQPGVATPSGVLDGVAVYTWSGSAWTPSSGTATPATPSGALRGVAAFGWDGSAWQPAAQARASVPTPYGALDGVAFFNWSGSAWAAGAALPPGVTLDLSFFGPTLDPSLTFTRASTATYFDSSGVMQTAATNAPRFDYNPVTHAALGLLIEEQRINSERNGNATGSTPGTPGTLPTNWAVLNSSGGTLAFNVIGSGTESGIPYVDIRMVGTPSGPALRLGMETANGIAAAVGQVWTGSIYARLVGGSLSNIQYLQTEFQVMDGTQTINAATTGTIWGVFTPTAAGLATQRTSLAWTVAVSSGTVAAIRLGIMPVLVSNGVPVDLTLRIGGVQLEQGAFATSYIPTTAAAVTRAYDRCFIPSANMGFYTSPGGSWAAEFITMESASNSVGARVIGLHGGGSAATPMYYDAGIHIGQWDGGNAPTTANGATVGSVVKAATAAGTGTLRCCLNGGVVASAVFTTGYTLLAGAGVGFMNDSSGAGEWAKASYIRRVRYWPRVLSNAELQSVTT